MAISPSQQIDSSVLEAYRKQLTGYCYRMLGSPFEADDAVQETMLRAWRSFDTFGGRGELRAWLYRIATNVCYDLIAARKKRATPMDFGPAAPPDPALLNVRSEATWIQPIPDALISDSADPADAAIARETVRLAFIAALQKLPAKQRAALILCEVLRWSAAETAELLETSVAAVNSALQRARAALDAEPAPGPAVVTAERLDAAQRDLLERFVDAFEAYDIERLKALLRDDAIQSMPPYDMWLEGRENVLQWWFGPGSGCAGSRLVPVGTANGMVAYGQYKPSESGGGHDPWALLVVEIGDGGIGQLTFFLDTATLFPLFGLPPHLDAVAAD